MQPILIIGNKSDATVCNVDTAVTVAYSLVLTGLFSFLKVGGVVID